MQKLQKKVICFLLASLVLISGIPVTGGTSVRAAGEDISQKEYEIYPIPRSLEYEDGTMALGNTANLIIESTVDTATENRLYDILESRQIDSKTSEEVSGRMLNILVGTKGSGEIVDQWFDENVTYNAELFDKVDAYVLTIQDGFIAVLGKDTDAAFYGLSTLKMVIDQTEGEDVRCLSVEDYASGQYRGFIEGYYGIPWSVDDRISLMQFGGDFKMNIYIFAPKDDPYHNTHWREPYPEEDLANIERMVAAGAAAKCRFAWAIHPFMNDAITMAEYDTGLEAIQTKFQQLYDAGVRQFVLSADDASSQVTLQAKLCKDMTEWVKSKGDCYNLVFVPQVYCTSAVTWSNWGGSTVQQYFSYFSDIEDLEIMWTGEWVCHPASQNTITNFKNQTGGKEAFMWLNWPVNDVNHARLVMGPAESGILEVGLTDFKGLVTNPLEQAEASKTSLFAIADFAWNTTDFSCFKSWEDGFKYIEPGAPEAMHELCKHLTNPAPGGITSMGESTELAPYITAFTDAYDGGNGTDYAQEAAALITQLEKIVKAADDFQENGTNVNLQDEMKPWVDSLRYLSNACISYIKTALAIQKGDADKICGNYISAINNYKASQNCEAPQLNGSLMVEAGAMKIMPFAALMDGAVKEDAQAVFGRNFGGKETLSAPELIYSGLGGFHQGDASKITDGDDTTYAWFNNSVNANAYIGMDLGDVYKLDTIRILQGKDESHKDIFAPGVLESSTDDEHWTEIGTYQENTIEANVLDQSIAARYVRLRTPSATGKWYAIREFTVTKQPIDHFVYTNVESCKKYLMEVDDLNASVSEITDDITLEKDEFIGLELSAAREITSLSANYTDKDGLVLEYSYNDYEWNTLQTPFSEFEARYIRIRNQGDAAVTFHLSDFSVEYTEENRTVFSEPKGLAGKEAPKAMDNSLETLFSASAGPGSMTWRMKSEAVDTLYILQSVDKISNAKVQIRTAANAWADIGILNKSFNVFEGLLLYGPVNEIKLTWKENGPSIYEMYTKNGGDTKSDLLNATVELAKSKPENKYTADSYAAFKKAILAAEAVMGKADATDAEIEAALKSIYQAAEKLVEKEPEPPVDQNRPIENLLKNDYTETVKDLKYRVTNAAKKEAVVYGVKSKKQKKITIPAEVTLNKVTCKVTGIAGKAFSGMKNLQTVTIGKNVKEIGPKAFYQDKKLKTIKVNGSVLKKVAKDAFKKARNKGTIKVPKAKKKAYAKLFKKATKMKVK